jgi:hypothetical protein
MVDQTSRKAILVHYRTAASGTLCKPARRARPTPVDFIEGSVVKVSLATLRRIV